MADLIDEESSWSADEGELDDSEVLLAEVSAGGSCVSELTSLLANLRNSVEERDCDFGRTVKGVLVERVLGVAMDELIALNAERRISCL